MEPFLRTCEGGVPDFHFLDDASNPDSFDVVESTPEGPLVSKRIALRDLIDWANDREVHEAANTPVPKFKMVHLVQDEYNCAPLLSRSLWDGVFDALHIGTWLKYMSIQSHQGFWQSQKGAMDNAWAFMYGNGRGSVVWRYSASTARTRAVFFGFPHNGEYFRERLVWYNGSAGHPLFPGFVSAINDVSSDLGDLVDHNTALNRLEETTGYQNKDVFYPKANTWDRDVPLSELSKAAATISNKIAYNLRNINISKQIFDLLVHYSSHPIATEPVVWKDVADVVSCILQEIENQEGYNLVMAKRVENQMTIVST